MTDTEAQLQSIRRGLATRPEDIETAKLAPIFVPSSFFASGNWPGPYMPLRAREIGLTWSVLLPDETMLYLSHTIMGYWEAEQLDWKALALRNLAAQTDENPGTHAFRRTSGEIYGIAMMHQDGIGPSRLLLRDRLSKLFPTGYRVALPEMSCALAFSVDVDGAEMEKLRGIIEKCSRDGTRPLATGIYASDDLLPEAEAT